jgi:superfamily I DNA/RNA helicase
LDAIELGRQRAAAIHTGLVAQGCDPFDPMALVRGAAKQRGIDEITALKPGSALLGTSRASFDPQSRGIQHEETGNPFLNAFLIGHELGHAVLGDDRLPDQACSPDPARSAEAAPVGEERVADYSRKSRREVQMDLFSRELLMPRAFVRELHVGGMTAEMIAKRLGAPYDAVAQQLLDALLLPPVEPAEDEDKHPLNARQAEAARHRGAAFLLEAGPGTGKTKTLVGRVCDLVAEREHEEGEDPRGIVVLTYSNKAAGELSSRIAARAPEAAAAMWIGTFHAFGLNLVRRFHKEFGFTREPRLLDRTEAIELMLEKVAGLELDHYRDLLDPTDKLRDLLGAISRAQDEVVLAPRYAELVEAMLDGDDSPETLERVVKAREVARVYASYTSVKLAGNRVDFGDLVALPTDLFERRPEIARQLREEYSHILVDEYQDVNRASVRLLQQLTKQGRNLWCVGDVRQSIYRFRGASSFNLERFDTEDFPGGVRDQLEVNYRSRDEIVRAYSTFAENMPVKGATKVELEAFRGVCGVKPGFSHVNGETEREIDAVADSIKAMRDQDFAYRDQALLCSGNDRLAKLGAGLEARGIPILYLGSLFERPEVKDLLAWLSLLTDRRAMALARGTGAAGLKLGLADVAAISEALRDDASDPLAWARMPPASLTSAGRLTVDAYAQLLDGFGADSSPWRTLAHLLLDRSRIAAEIAGSNVVAARARGIALWQFLNFVRAEPGPSEGAINRLLERIRRLVRLSDDRDLRHIPAAAAGIGAVRLMTMHGSKGLEFPVVHIPGMTKGTLPRGASVPACPPPDGMIAGTTERGRAVTDREHQEEQECLFYVALSRARDRLFLYSPDKTKAGARAASKREPSVFVDRLGLRIDRTRVVPGAYDVSTDEPRVDIGYQGGPVFTQSELSLYERCPRRFFYTHILRLGGRRVTTAYEDLHDVVRAAMTELLRAPELPTDPASLTALIDRHWAASPLADKANGHAYRPFADELLARFVRGRAAGTLVASSRLALPLGGAEIRVDVEYALRRTDGSVTLRQVRTGHKRTTEMNGAAVMALLLAAQHGVPGCDAEVLFLSDDAAERLALEGKPLETRLSKLAASVAAILAGEFPTDPSTRTCPKCPAFFTCGAVPEGRLEKNFG